MTTIHIRQTNTDKLTADEQLWAYNGADCMITFEVFEALEPKLPEVPFAYDMSRTMQGPAFTLMHRGVKIDMGRRIEVLSSLNAQRERCQGIFFRLCHEGLDIPAYEDKKAKKTYAINPASSKQLCTLFYEVLGFPPIKSYNKLTKDYSVSCDRKALEKLQKEPRAKVFCELILAIRDYDKKIQVLTSGIDKGRMHTAYQVAGPMTGRWSSNVDPFGRGTNLQNITDEMRRVFIPDSGKKFCQLDLAQAESKLVAYLALRWGRGYKDACLSGDLHTTVTKLVWGELFRGSNLPDKEVAKKTFYRHFTYRDMAKRGGHGSNYGGSAAVIAMHLNIPLEQAQAFQDGYFKAFKEIRAWQQSVKVALATTRSIVTPLGRRCFFPGRPWDNDTIKSAIAYAPQSSIGDVLNLGFYKVWRKYDKLFDPSNPIEILTQVHDSILFQYDPAIEAEIVPLIQKELKVPVEISGEVCEIEVDAQVGWNWGKYSSKNTFGLKDWAGSDDRLPPQELSILDRELHFLHKVL